MPPLSALPVFALASLTLLLIPGPSVLYIVTRSSVQGPRAGVASVLGVHVGSLVHVTAAAAGLSALVLASSAAFTAVKVLGGLYLLAMGLRQLLHARRHNAVVSTGADLPPSAALASRPWQRLFVDGVVINTLNPKVALFFLAFLPQFVAPDHGPVWSQTAALGLCYILIGIGTDTCYALAGAKAGAWLRRHGGVRRRGRYAEGAVMIGLGLTTLALPHRHPGS